MYNRDNFHDIKIWISFYSLQRTDKPGISTGVVGWTCNPATLEAEFWNGVGSIPVGGNSPSIGGWIVRPPVIQH